MLKYLFVLLVVPALRRLVVLAAMLMAAAFLVTIPARLWLLYVDPGLSDCSIIVLNSTTSGCLVGLVLGRRRRR